MCRMIVRDGLYDLSRSEPQPVQATLADLPDIDSDNIL